jgi:hypothetical protein
LFLEIWRYVDCLIWHEEGSGSGFLGRTAAVSSFPQALPDTVSQYRLLALAEREHILLVSRSAAAQRTPNVEVTPVIVGQ